MPTLNLTQCATAALQFLHVLDSGEAPSAQQLTDALGVANNLLDNWSTEGIMVPAALVQAFGLTASQQSYTIGAGQAFSVTRPIAITAAAMRIAFGPSSGVEVVDAVKWAAIPDRQSQSWQPRFLFYDRGYPTGTVYLSPVPLGGQVELTMWAPLTQFADATTAITILPGYARLIETALAFEIAPQYDVAPSQTLIASYQDSVERIRALNGKLLGIEPPPPPQKAQ